MQKKEEKNNRLRKIHTNTKTSLNLQLPIWLRPKLGNIFSFFAVLCPKNELENCRVWVTFCLDSHNNVIHRNQKGWDGELCVCISVAALSVTPVTKPNGSRCILSPQTRKWRRSLREGRQVKVGLSEGPCSPNASSSFPVFSFSSSENMPAGLITGTDPGWRCMPLHMAAQIKMSPAACLSNSLALCPSLSQELQPDLSIWCSQHGGRPVYWHRLLPELTKVNKRVARNTHVWPANANSSKGERRSVSAQRTTADGEALSNRGGGVNPIRTAALCDSWTHVSGSFQESRQNTKITTIKDRSAGLATAAWRLIKVSFIAFY